MSSARTEDVSGTRARSLETLQRRHNVVTDRRRRNSNTRSRRAPRPVSSPAVSPRPDDEVRERDRCDGNNAAIVAVVRAGRPGTDENGRVPAAGRHGAGVVRPAVRRGRVGPEVVRRGGQHHGGGARGHGGDHAQRPRPGRGQRDGDGRESSGDACGVCGRARLDRVGDRREAGGPVEQVRDRRHEAAGDSAVRGRGEGRRDGRPLGDDDGRGSLERRRRAARVSVRRRGGLRD